MDEQPEELGAEARLLSLAKSGDLDAFEQIVVLYERRIFGCCLRPNRADTDRTDHKERSKP